jgi:hypothetical protein
MLSPVIGFSYHLHLKTLFEKLMIDPYLVVVRCNIGRDDGKEKIMTTNTIYEGDGFLRKGPAYFALPIEKLSAKPADRKVTVIGDAEGVEIEKREMALRREYLPEWICKLLDN